MIIAGDAGGPRVWECEAGKCLRTQKSSRQIKNHSDNADTIHNELSKKNQCLPWHQSGSLLTTQNSACMVDIRGGPIPTPLTENLRKICFKCTKKGLKLALVDQKYLFMLQLWLPDRCICIYFFCLKCKSFRDESGWYIWDLLVGGSSLISSESSPPCQSTHRTIDSFISPQKFYTMPFKKVIQLSFQHCLKYCVELGLNVMYFNNNIPRKSYHLTFNYHAKICENKTVWTFCLWRPS